MACGCSEQVMFGDFDVKKWPVKTGGLSRQVACQDRWPVIGGQIYNKFIDP